MLQGRVITMLAGEGHRQDLDDLITAALEVYGERGELSATPLPLTLERNKDTRQGARRVLRLLCATGREKVEKHACEEQQKTCILQKAQGAAGSLQTMQALSQFVNQVVLHESGQLVLSGSSMHGCIM